MVDREVAYRIFAKELNDSSSTIHSTVDEVLDPTVHTPNYLLTRGGLMVNRVFITGVLTEVESVDDGSNTLRARIIGPSGAFTLYAGQYQSNAVNFFSSVELPEYVYVVGKVRSYVNDTGIVLVSLRPEEIGLANEDLYNRWVLDTAELTLDRVDIFSNILEECSNGSQMEDCINKFNIPFLLSEGVGMAIRNYGVAEKDLNDIRLIVRNAIKSIDANSNDPDEKDVDTLVLELLAELDIGKGVDYFDLLAAATSRQLNEKTVDSVVRSLLSKGQCYEPRAGILKIIR